MPSVFSTVEAWSGCPLWYPLPPVMHLKTKAAWTNNKQRKGEIYRITNTVFNSHTLSCCGVGNTAVGIPIRYGLDGPGIRFRWGRDYSHPCRPALGPTQTPIQRVLSHCRGESAPSTAEVKERVYVYSTSVPWWNVIWWTWSVLYRLHKQSSCNLVSKQRFALMLTNFCGHRLG